MTKVTKCIDLTPVFMTAESLEFYNDVLKDYLKTKGNDGK